MNHWNRALVTGASSGIGEAFARRLADEGTDLVLVARNATKLQELSDELSVECEVLVADLADRYQLDRVEQRLAQKERPIDLLVNNAGFGFVGDFVNLDIEKESDEVAVNIVALQRLAHAGASAMVQLGRGAILNVSSIASFGPAPGSATYSASKAFVTSFSQALHGELAPKGVQVCALCPGFTRTDFQRRADYDVSEFPDFLWQSPEAVVEAGLKGLVKNKAVVVSGAQNKLVASIASVAPSSVLRLIGQTFYRKTNISEISPTVDGQKV